MLTMTAAAGAYLTDVLERAKAPREMAVRIRLQDEALTPTLDTARPGDETLEHQGKMVLLLDARARDYLTGSTLDVEATPEGPKLLVLD